MYACMFSMYNYMTVRTRAQMRMSHTLQKYSHTSRLEK